MECPRTRDPRSILLHVLLVGPTPSEGVGRSGHSGSGGRGGTADAGRWRVDRGNRTGVRKSLPANEIFLLTSPTLVFTFLTLAGKRLRAHDLASGPRQWYHSSWHVWRTRCTCLAQSVPTSPQEPVQRMAQDSRRCVAPHEWLRSVHSNARAEAQRDTSRTRLLFRAHRAGDSSRGCAPGARLLAGYNLYLGDRHRHRHLLVRRC